jgi:hypothetical protein
LVKGVPHDNALRILKKGLHSLLGFREEVVGRMFYQLRHIGRAPVQMDEMDEGRLTGVTDIDRGEASADQLFARAVMLAAGDIAMLLLFAAIGRGSHSGEYYEMK